MSAAAFLSALGRASLEAAVLVLLVLAVQGLFRRKLSAQVRCALWLVVAVRLLPFTLSSAASLFNLLPRWSTLVTAGATTATARVVAAAAPAADAPTARDRRSPARPVADAIRVDADEQVEPRVHATAHSAPATSIAPRPPLSVAQWLFLGWAAGAAALVAYIAVSSWATARCLRRVTPVTLPEALVVLQSACARLNLRRVPTLVQSSAVNTPALYGLFRPTLVLPANFLTTFSVPEWSYVFLHEIAHVKRRDLLLNWLFAGLQALHWFNPFVWFAFARWRVDREVACDALALESAGAGSNREYGRTMLQLLELSTGSFAAPGVVGIAEDKRQLKRRLQMIVAFVPARRTSLLALAVCVTVATVGLTDAQVARPTTQPESQKTAMALRTVKVTVLDDASGTPIKDARVLVYQLMDYRQPDSEKGVFHTNEAGQAEFSVPLDPELSDQPTFGISVGAPGHGGRGVQWISTGGNVRQTLPVEKTVRLGSAITVGGTVRDEQGRPVAGAQITLMGSDYKGFRNSSNQPAFTDVQEYPSYVPADKVLVKTDAAGNWVVPNVPADLRNVQIEVRRPDGAVTLFSAGERGPVNVPKVDLEGLRSKQAVLTLAEGRPVRGVVVDAKGAPVEGAHVWVRDTDRAKRYTTYDFVTAGNGRIDLPHWTADSVIITATKQGFATKSVTLDLDASAAAARVVLPPAKPLRLRVVDEAGAPVQATVSAVEYRSGDQILNWWAKADAEGRIVWNEAPDQPVVIAAYAEGVGQRQMKVAADGTEQVVRLRKSSGKVAIDLRVTDAASGAPVDTFEVWRKLVYKDYEPWEPLGSHGAFHGELLNADFVPGWSPSYSLQVRARGYARWTSDRLELPDGDQSLAVKLVAGPDREDPLPDRRISRSINAVTEKDPALQDVVRSVIRLLEDRNVDAFVTATNASVADWVKAVPQTSNPDGPLGAKPDERVRSAAKTLTRSTQHFVDLAEKFGLRADAVTFRLKSALSSSRGASIYRVNGATVEVPYVFSANVVLTAEARTPEAKSLAGDYELSIGGLRRLGDVWRIDRGLRWSRLPDGVGDAAVRGELALLNKIDAGARGPVGAGVSNVDDPDLTALGEKFVTLLRTRDVPAFAAQATLTADETRALYQRHGWGSEKRAEESTQRSRDAVTQGAQELLRTLTQVGADFSDARITVRQVIADRASATDFGDVDGLRGNKVRIRLAVETNRSSATGKPLAGEYIIALEDIIHASGHWSAADQRIRWQQLPAGLLTADDTKALELENYIAQNRSLPKGYAVPDIDMVRLADSTHARLSELRGKVVVLEFWASWCGPCQEPMSKLQETVARHPEWKDKVEVIALSIDDKAKQASDHLAKREWTKTANYWAGEGGFQAKPVTAFRVSGVPTTYVISREGKVVQAGHPESLNLERIIAAQLE